MDCSMQSAFVDGHVASALVRAAGCLPMSTQFVSVSLWLHRLHRGPTDSATSTCHTPLQVGLREHRAPTCCGLGRRRAPLTVNKMAQPSAVRIRPCPPIASRQQPPAAASGGLLPSQGRRIRGRRCTASHRLATLDCWRAVAATLPGPVWCSDPKGGKESWKSPG
jgi:hypothetical protein